MNDPWKHRSSGMKCATCMWFVAKAGGQSGDSRGALGRCRKSHPTMNGFPAVFETDWCGSHKLDETKLVVEAGPVEVDIGQGATL